MERIHLDHLCLDDLTLEGAIDEIGRLISTDLGGIVITPNLQISADLRGRPGFDWPEISLCDSYPVRWAALLSGQDVGRVTGADLIVPLCSAASRQGWSVALVGSTETALRLLKAKLTARWPTLRITTALSPPPGFEENPEVHDEVVAQILDRQAAITFIGLGHPKQHRLAQELRQHGGTSVYIEVGAAIDYLTGDQRRAPAWMRSIAMEWLWRLLTNPRRLARRYLREAPQEIMRLSLWALKRRISP